MIRFLVCVVGCCATLLIVEQATAQMTAQERRTEERVRMALDPAELAILKKERRLVIDYGVWINHLFSDFKDDDNDSAAKDATNLTYAMDQRAWVRATLRPPADGNSENEHSVYLRLKNKDTWRDPADANGRFDWNGPHVDYAFLTLDLRPFLLQAGRRFYQVGEGIAYSNVNDGVELLVSGATWSLMGFVSRTPPHEDNIDLSIPGDKHSGRTFYAIEGKYLGIPNHGVYGYALWQADDEEEHPENPTQDFDYNSQYVALGSEGKLLANLRYASELILETGHSITSSTSREEDIMAWAMDASFTYDVQLPLQPTVSFEYAFGSGDSDRINVTDTIDGNAAGRDTNFLYFGYLPTGYALSPRLSNLRMFKGGISLKPLEWLSFFKELTCSLDVYRFYKEESKGGIFDAQASQNDRDVGVEIDLTLSWPILSDLGLAIEYGHFEPGEAFPAATNDRTRYFSVGVTTTF